MHNNKDYWPLIVGVIIAVIVALLLSFTADAQGPTVSWYSIPSSPHVPPNICSDTWWVQNWLEIEGATPDRVTVYVTGPFKDSVEFWELSNYQDGGHFDGGHLLTWSGNELVNVGGRLTAWWNIRIDSYGLNLSETQQHIWVYYGSTVYHYVGAPSVWDSRACPGFRSYLPLILN